MSNAERKQKPQSVASRNAQPEARPRNWLVPVMLLSLQQWNSYGYELMERAADFGFGAMNPGTMYRTLRHMEENGTVKSKWETSGAGPARRMYSITDAGEAYLDLWASSLVYYQQTMDTFFRLYRGTPRRINEKKDAQ
jgi:PadR family transcriptional regulator, regulatory protein PadR